MQEIYPLSDLELIELVPLAHEFYDEGFLSGKVRPEVFITNWSDWLRRDLAILLGFRDEDDRLVGCIGGLIAPDSLDGAPVANEMFWFVAASHRGSRSGLRLLDEFEKEARRRGAERISMVHLANSVGEKLAPFLKRRGYRPLETHYMKEV